MDFKTLVSDLQQLKDDVHQLTHLVANPQFNPTFTTEENLEVNELIARKRTEAIQLRIKALQKYCG